MRDAVLDLRRVRSTCLDLNLFFTFSYEFCVDFVTGGLSVLLNEWALDEDPRRFALIATLPVIYCISIVSFMFSFRHTRS